MRNQYETPEELTIISEKFTNLTEASSKNQNQQRISHLNQIQKQTIIRAMKMIAIG